MNMSQRFTQQQNMTSQQIYQQNYYYMRKYKLQIKQLEEQLQI